MAARTYKKYMKKNVSKDYTLLKLFVISFFGMLLIFTILIKSFTPAVDVSIGDYKQDEEISQAFEEEIKKNVDNRLAIIQEEDIGQNFRELVKSAEDAEKVVKPENLKKLSKTSEVDEHTEEDKTVSLEPIYKVFIGTYTSAEQAKVAKDIIVESGSNLNPIVKCIGSNNYTLQVGIFKNKQSADALLFTVQQNHLPGRIVAEY